MAQTGKRKGRAHEEKAASSKEENIAFRVRYRENTMLAKIRQVPAECMAEVSDFVDSVIERERKRHNKAFIDSIAALADEPFSRYWDNPIDAEYDKL